MDVKTVFLNGDLDENIYVDQLMGFLDEGKEHIMCKLKKPIYELKEAFCKWYLKFYDTIVSFGFKENTTNQCIYLKVNRSRVIFLILYVDNIFLTTNDHGLLCEIKKFLSTNFEIKDMAKESYLIGIEIFQDRS
uniref:Retrovirus-related Pol polyprotein from transposon TNT 1-94 n=1 Tax=Cajanus cajan TaxID=3821 RepID=A0A151SFV3_CAJCA|nr:Retrovirus-related Pol polyprotein from transposon TNT 1-94 [Cajanus cajan]